MADTREEGLQPSWRCDAQWKGTSTCLDVNCGECKTFAHYCIDMPWSGSIKCPGCGAVAQVGWRLSAQTTTDEHMVKYAAEASGDD